MSRRVLQAAIAAALCASCQSESSAQPEGGKERPFSVSEVAFPSLLLSLCRSATFAATWTPA